MIDLEDIIGFWIGSSMIFMIMLMILTIALLVKEVFL